ncbi:hypothetical protein Bbelb_144170 [Branchiostoma belcheri]|nr:hypothetical protein Bbelb_144170 [Branchiostoma belcheri]
MAILWTLPRGYGHRNIPRLWRVTIAKDSLQASPAWVRHNVAWVPTKKNLGRKKYRDWDESKEQKEGRGPKGRENATSGPRNSRVWRLDWAGILTPKATRRHTMLLDIVYVIFPTPSLHQVSSTYQNQLAGGVSGNMLDFLREKLLPYKKDEHCSRLFCMAIIKETVILQAFSPPNHYQKQTHPRQSVWALSAEEKEVLLGEGPRGVPETDGDLAQLSSCAT